MIIGYQYSADEYHPSCMIDELVDRTVLSPAARDMDPETVLDQHAGANAIDREDEATFDSGDFPKVIGSWHGDMEGRTCGRCGEELA